MDIHHDINVSQQLNLAPQLLQWLRILQVSTTDLTDLVQKELESNPALEIDESRADEHDVPTSDDFSDPSATNTIETSSEEPSLDAKYELLAEIDDEWRNDNNTVNGSKNSTNSEDDQERHQFALDSATTSGSIYNHLSEQLNLLNINEDDHAIAEVIIGSLDSNGYLSISIEELSSITSTPATRIEKVLTIVQTLEPVGIAARSLQECMIIQMHSLPEDALPRRIAKDYLEALGREQYTHIAASLDVSVDEVMAAKTYITTLSPYPALSFTPESTQYITADITVRENNGKYIIELNDEKIPHLRISASCRQLLKKDRLSAEEISYIRSKIRSATFLIQGINQRHETLRKVCEQITRVQREFLDDENGRLQPLTMAKVAGIIGVHETTVSRALANKHIRTPRGLFEMKHFFRAGYHCSDGSALTPEVVKEIISDLINKEDPESPVRDIDIVNQLKQKGLKLARRTVAKYRDEMSIPSSKERKKEFLLPSQDHIAAVA